MACSEANGLWRHFTTVSVRVTLALRRGEPGRASEAPLGKGARRRLEEASSTSDNPPLEARIEELIELSRRLAAENHALRTQMRSLAAQRASLVARNERAESLVESIIGRLKALEQEP